MQYIFSFSLLIFVSLTQVPAVLSLMKLILEVIWNHGRQLRQQFFTIYAYNSCLATYNFEGEKTQLTMTYL